ncbi:MAG: hypothetical protein Q4C35_08730 [Eubacteriales bacterium]|nr:hypothetical protein [Eubacteriales bacterium]
MQKKLVGLALAFVILVASVSAFAQILPPISPYYTDTSLIGAGLSIENGVAKCDGFVTPNSSTKIATVSVRLQRLVNGRWSQLASWSETASAGSTAVAGGNKSISKGYSYRVMVYGTVKDANGNVLERTSCASNTKQY